jgi:hypothetical protein
MFVGMEGLVRNSKIRFGQILEEFSGTHPEIDQEPSKEHRQLPF